MAEKRTTRHGFPWQNDVGFHDDEPNQYRNGEQGISSLEQTSPPKPTRRRLDRRARRASAVLAAACTCLGAGVLVGGWLAGIELFKRILPAYVAMAPGTAACFVLVGAGLVLYLRRDGRRSFTAGLWISAVVAAIVLGNMLLPLSAPYVGGQQLLLPNWPDGAATAVATKVEFLASAYCLAALSHQRLWNAHTYSLVATTGLLVASAAVVGYLFRSSDFHEAFLFNAMALHTAAGLVMLHAAFLLAQPRGAWVSILLGRGSGSARARKLFPIALVTPLALCFAALVMTDAGLFSANLRLAILAIAMMALSAGVVLLNAAKENQAVHLAQHDPLTGLANRALFSDCLDRALASARRRGREVGLVLIDLDHFKTTNDTFGHLVGDGVLRTMADRLRQAVSPEDTAARVGGDEFAAILADRGSPDEIERDARGIHRALCRPLTVEAHDLIGSASIGVATFPRDASEAEGLVVAADKALYGAKALGRRCVFVFAERTVETFVPQRAASRSAEAT